MIHLALFAQIIYNIINCKIVVRMQAALLLVFLLIICLILWVYVTHISEGFVVHDLFVIDRLKKFGNVGISLQAANNVGALGDSATKLLSTESKPIKAPLNKLPTGLDAFITTCEAIQTMDCNAFDDPAFTMNCGMCLDIGTNSKKASIPGGGLVMLPEDKQLSREVTTGNFLPVYIPAIGFCPAGKFVTTKAECIKLQRQLYCQKNASFDIPGCSQCYSDGSFSIIDANTSPGVVAGHGTILIVGSGKLTIQEQGFDPVVGIILSSTSPYEFQVRVKEGDKIRFILIPVDNNTNTFMAGYITGITTNGEFLTDLNAIVLNDEVTGRKPRSAGRTRVRDNAVLKLAPGFGQKNMTLVVVIPFTFVDNFMEESSMCVDAPFITTLAGSQALASNPCYVRGSGPGKYNLECLQNTWLNNGCNQNGTAYPADASSASTLMSNPNGSLRSINDISDVIYNNALITSTGIDQNGVKQSIKNWSNASVFCTGVPIFSPCDGPLKDSGPLSPDCIIFLWRNVC